MAMKFSDAHPDLREIYRAWLARCTVACSKTLPYEPAREEFGFGSRGDHEHAKARRKWARSIVDDDAAQSYFAGWLKFEHEEYSAKHSDVNRAISLATNELRRDLRNILVEQAELRRQEG